MGDSTFPSGATISNNVILDPRNTAFADFPTAIGVQCSNVTVTGNVLMGALARGVRAVTGIDRYVITNNILSSATTPVYDENATATKYVANNI